MRMEDYDFECLYDVHELNKTIRGKCNAFIPICPTSFLNLFR